MAIDEFQPMEFLRRHTHALVKWTAVVSEDWHKELPVHPIVPKTLIADTDCCPVLLDLAELNNAQMDRLYWNLVEAEKYSYRHLLSSLLYVPPEVSTKSLVFHLTNKVIPDAHHTTGQILVLNYYMPMVFPHMWRIFSPERIRQLFGPIKEWSIPFQNEWTTFTPPETTGVIPRYWSATNEQVQSVLRIGLINQIFEYRMEATGMRWANLDEFHADATKLDQILVFAEQHYQMRDKDDLISFGLHAMLYGTDFHRHPKIQEMLKDVAQKGWGYTPNSMDLTEEDWQAIAAWRPVTPTD